jgi:hypothetical protein
MDAASLLHKFFVFDPNLRSSPLLLLLPPISYYPSNILSGGREDREAEKLLFYHPESVHIDKRCRCHHSSLLAQQSSPNILQ